MAYPITDIRCIGNDIALILRSEGIRTTIGLLRCAKTPKQRLKIAEKVGTDDKCVLDWVTAADAHARQGRRLGICRAVVRGRRRQRPSTNSSSAIRRSSSLPDDRSQ